MTIMRVSLVGSDLSETEKQSLAARLIGAFAEVEVGRDAPEVRGDFWMTILEVPEGGWGYGGRAVSIGSLAPAFAEDRRERIHSYLDGRESR